MTGVSLIPCQGTTDAAAVAMCAPFVPLQTNEQSLPLAPDNELTLLVRTKRDDALLIRAKWHRSR